MFCPTNCHKNGPFIFETIKNVEFCSSVIWSNFQINIVPLKTSHSVSEFPQDSKCFIMCLLRWRKLPKIQVWKWLYLIHFRFIVLYKRQKIENMFSKFGICYSKQPVIHCTFIFLEFHKTLDFITVFQEMCFKKLFVSKKRRSEKSFVELVIWRVSAFDICSSLRNPFCSDFSKHLRSKSTCNVT